MRPLRIPYAVDVERHVKISASDIAEMMEDPSSTVRLQATAHLSVGAPNYKDFAPYSRTVVYRYRYLRMAN